MLTQAGEQSGGEAICGRTRKPKKELFLVGFPASAVSSCDSWTVPGTIIDDDSGNAPFARTRTKTAKDPFGMKALKVKLTLLIELMDSF